MTIKNETAFTKECMEGAMRASNFDNSRYKTFKLIYNMFGLIFGMMMIRELVLKMTGNEQGYNVLHQLHCYTYQDICYLHHPTDNLLLHGQC